MPTTMPPDSPDVSAAVVTLLDSASDDGCDGDVIVVSKSSLRALAAVALKDGAPAWLTDTDDDEPA